MMTSAGDEQRDEQLLVAGTMKGQLLLFASNAAGCFGKEMLEERHATSTCDIHADWEHTHVDHPQGGRDRARSDSVLNPLPRSIGGGSFEMGETVSPLSSEGHCGAVTSVVWLNTDLVVSGSFDKRMLVWRVVSNGAELKFAGEMNDTKKGSPGRHDHSVTTTAHDDKITVMQSFCCTFAPEEMEPVREALPFLALPLPLHQRLMPLLVVLPQEPDAHFVASASVDNSIKIWWVHIGANEHSASAPLFTIKMQDDSSNPGHGVCSMAWLDHPEGPEGSEGWLATGDSDNMIKILDLNLDDPGVEWSVIKVLNGHKSTVDALTWLPHQGEGPAQPGTHPAFTTAVPSWPLLRHGRCAGHHSTHGSVCVCTGWLLSGSKDGTVRTWRLRPAQDDDDDTQVRTGAVALKMKTGVMSFRGKRCARSNLTSIRGRATRSTDLLCALLLNAGCRTAATSGQSLQPMDHFWRQQSRLRRAARLLEP